MNDLPTKGIGNNSGGYSKAEEEKHPSLWFPPSAVVKQGIASNEDAPKGRVMVEDMAERNARLVETFGRASLWKHMLDIRSREASMLQTIVEEVSGVLDQGVLPCAPSGEEKVVPIVRYTVDRASTVPACNVSRLLYLVVVDDKVAHLGLFISISR